MTVLPFAAAGVAKPIGADAPDLDAVVTYETRSVLPSGVVRQERWQERLVRSGKTLWSERVLPPEIAGHRHEAAEAGAHRHFDFEAAARLLTLDGDGGPVLRCVDRERRVIVSVPAAEYGAVGFDGRWDGAAFVVPPAVVERMTPLGHRESPSGTRWLGDRSAGWTHTVLWSQARRVALRAESARDDGTFRRIVTVVPRTASAASALPWRQLDGFAHKGYDEFMN